MVSEKIHRMLEREPELRLAVLMEVGPNMMIQEGAEYAVYSVVARFQHLDQALQYCADHDSLLTLPQDITILK